MSKRLVLRAALFTLILSMGTFGSACKAPPEAPTELSELSAFLFANWENDDLVLMADGMQNLYEFLSDPDNVDLAGDTNDRAFTPDPLGEADTVDVDHPDRDAEAQLPVALVIQSAFPSGDHASVIVMADQTPVEPNSPDTYNREFLDPDDPSGFPGRDDLQITTMNEIVKKNALMEIPYDMNKDFRWIEMGEEGSGSWGILGRSWCAEEAFGVDGNVEINQSFSIDVFMPHDGGVIRYMTLWSETTISGIDDETVAGTTRYGMGQMFDETEEYLEENF